MDNSQTVSFDNTQITAVVQSLSKDLPCKTNGDHIDENLHDNDDDAVVLSSSSKKELSKNANIHYPMAEQDNVTNSKKAKYEEHERISLKRKLSESDDETSPHEKHIRFDECSNIGIDKSNSPKVIDSSDSNDTIGEDEESQSSSNQHRMENCDFVTSSPLSNTEAMMPPLSNYSESMDDRRHLLSSSQEFVSRYSQEVNSDNLDDSGSPNRTETVKNEFCTNKNENIINNDGNNLHSSKNEGEFSLEENVNNITKIAKLPLLPSNRSSNISRLSFEYETYDEYDDPVRFRSNNNDNENNGDNIELLPQRFSQVFPNDKNETSNEDNATDEINIQETKSEGYATKNDSIPQRLVSENNEQEHIKEVLMPNKKQGFEEVRRRKSINVKDVGIVVSENKKVPVSLVNYEYGDFSASEESNASDDVPGNIKKKENDDESESDSDSENEQVSTIRSKSGSKTSSRSSSQSSSRSSSTTRSNSPSITRSISISLSRSRSRSRSRSKTRSKSRSYSRNSNLDNVERLSSNQSNEKIEEQTGSSLCKMNESESEEDNELVHDIHGEESKNDSDKIFKNSYSALLNDESSCIDAGNQFQDTDSRLSPAIDSENSSSTLLNKSKINDSTTNSDKCDEPLPVVASCSKDEFLRILEKSIDKNCDSTSNSNDSDRSVVNKDKKIIVNKTNSTEEPNKTFVSYAEDTTNLDLGIDLSKNQMDTNNTMENSKDSSYDDDNSPIDFSKVKSSIVFPDRNENSSESFQDSQNLLEQTQIKNNPTLFNLRSPKFDKLPFTISNNKIERKLDALNLTISPTIINDRYQNFGNKNENDPPDIANNGQISQTQTQTQNQTSSLEKTITSAFEHTIVDNSDTVSLFEQNRNTSINPIQVNSVNENETENNDLSYNDQQLFNNKNQSNESFENITLNKNVYHCFKCDNKTFKTLYELRVHQNYCQIEKFLNHQQSSIITEQVNKVNKPISLLQQKLQQPLIVAPNSSQFYSQEPQKLPQSSSQISNNNDQLTALDKNNKTKKNIFFCSACKTFYDGWNLFLHMREVHNRHVCLYCVRIFPTGEKLTLHLELKHDLEQNHYISHERLLKSSSDTTFVMCCNCELVFSEQEQFVDHICPEIIKPCSICGIKGGHSLNCKGISKEEKKTRMKLKEKGKLNTIKKGTADNIKTKIPEIQQLTETTNVIQQQQQTIKINGWPSTNSENNINTNQQDMPNNFTNQLIDSEINKNPATPTISSELISTFEESNSSDQMVIDETCNNNNITYNNTESLMLSPFKNINKTESIYIQHSNRPNQRALPVGGYGQGKKISACDGPDMNDIETDEQLSTSVSENNQDLETAIPSAEEHLIVPKFKLRIPKQYQKSIDSDASSLISSESEQEYVDNDNDCEQEAVTDINDKQQIENISNDMRQDNTCNSNSTTPAQELDNERNYCSDVIEKQDNDNNFSIINNENNTETDIKLNSSFERSLNDFERIQREIEKTKMDIERTKMSFQMPSTVEPSEVSSEVPLNTDNSIIEQNNYLTNEKITEETGKEETHLMTEESNDNATSMPLSSQLQTLSQPPLVNGDSYESIENTIITVDQDRKSDVLNNTEPNVEEDASDGIILANNEVRPVDLFLDRPLDKISAVDFLRICVKTVFPLCLYCNHARRIAVSGNSLALHLLAEHRFSATVDSITAEELLPSTIVSRLKSFLPELENSYFNLESYCKIDGMELTSIIEERIFECYSCRFQTRVHKDLYLHNRKMHMKSAILCIMCRSNFFSYSEILCHKCPGVPNKISIFDIKYRCCLCEVDNIPSAFRLMVHLRKKHHACDICLEDCLDQNRLASHVWKHKLHHVCFRCGIGYRNKPDITKHLFWKHGTESIICKRCLQKRWRHVYHFCTPAPSFVCDICNLCFSKANVLKVHKRLHSNEVPHNCPEENCDQKFISKKLLRKHAQEHITDLETKPEIHEDPQNKLDSQENKLANEMDTDVTPKNVKDEKIQMEVADSDCNAKSQTDDKTPSTDAAVKDAILDNSGINKKKKKTNKKSIKERIDDLNLQAPNLSESDSSDDSDTEKQSIDDTINFIKSAALSPQSNDERMDDQIDLEDSTKIVDIWANFKSYQASQSQIDNDDKSIDENSNDQIEAKILHVSQSDHDYCLMFKSIINKNFETIYSEDKNLDNSGSSNNSPKLKDTDKEIVNKKRCESKSPKKKQKSPRKKNRSGSESSSSESSSSSCSCGSNCSCSSSDSNNSSSSSSSDDDSDSSNSVSRKKVIKEQSDAESTLKDEEENPAVVATTSEPTNTVENVKINDVKIEKPKELVIYESDLETSETDTDEDFYDDHPQKKAVEQLDEKRRQLMARASLSPHHHFDILVNSRPTTPSIPDGVVKEKKVKIKKKKHEKVSKLNLPTVKINENPEVIPSYNPLTNHQTDIFSPEVDSLPPFNLIASPGAAESLQHPITPLSHPLAHMPIHNIHPISKLAAAPIPQHNRMSTGSSCSDADASLKRSKRARRPNKFYGYTSDEELMQPTNKIIGGQLGHFKPTPPPPLTWCKEDLPSPSKSASKSRVPKQPKAPKKIKSTTSSTSGNSSKKNILNRERFLKGKIKRDKEMKKLPGIPTLKIRPLAAPSITSNIQNSEFISQTTLQQFAQPAPVIHPMQLTMATVNHIDEQQPQKYPSQEESSGSESSDDNDDKFNRLLPEFIQGKPSLSLLPPKKLWASQETYVQKPTPPLPPPKIPPALMENPDYDALQYFKRNNIRFPIRAPAGARPPRDGESVYCYCRCPYDEVSEMIACDGSNCVIEWFHFECVGIMLAPQGKWYCAECRPQYSNELYPV